MGNTPEASRENYEIQSTRVEGARLLKSRHFGGGSAVTPLYATKDSPSVD